MTGKYGFFAIAKIENNSIQTTVMDIGNLHSVTFDQDINQT
jgi:hypothetical protein